LAPRKFHQIHDQKRLHLSCSPEHCLFPISMERFHLDFEARPQIWFRKLYRCSVQLLWLCSYWCINNSAVLSVPDEQFRRTYDHFAYPCHNRCWRDLSDNRLPVHVYFYIFVRCDPVSVFIRRRAEIRWQLETNRNAGVRRRLKERKALKPKSYALNFSWNKRSRKSTK